MLFWCLVVAGLFMAMAWMMMRAFEMPEWVVAYGFAGTSGVLLLGVGTAMHKRDFWKAEADTANEICRNLINREDRN